MIDPKPTASHFIDGTYVEDDSGTPIPVIYAATGEEIARVHAATPTLVDRAIAAAKRAQPEWVAMSGTERGRILRAVIVQPDTAGLVRIIRIVVVPHRLVDGGHAHRDGQTDQQAKPRSGGGQHQTAHACIRQHIGAQRVAQDVAGNADIAGIQIAAVDMGDEAPAQRRIDRCTDAVFVVHAVVAGEPIDMDRLVRDAAGNALVDHVDRAADGLAAVEQHGRAAQNLDPFDGERIDADRVIVRGIRRIERSDPVVHHPHAFATEAANHRARCTGRESAARDAGQVFEDFADLAVHVPLQLDALDHRGPREDVQLAEAPSCGDDDVRLLAGAVVKIVAGIIAVLRRIVGGLRLSCARDGGEDEREQRQTAEGGKLHRGTILLVCDFISSAARTSGSGAQGRTCTSTGAIAGSSESRTGRTNGVRGHGRSHRTHTASHIQRMRPTSNCPEENGAGEAIRTPDPNLGKVVLYP